MDEWSMGVRDWGVNVSPEMRKEFEEKEERHSVAALDEGCSRGCEEKDGTGGKDDEHGAFRQIAASEERRC